MSLEESGEIVILDVGHGNATAIHDNQSTILIDAASGAHVLEYLTQRNIQSLELVILSHSDSDHIGGLLPILNAGIRIGLVLVNTDSEKESKIWEDLIFSLEDARRLGKIDFKVGITAGTINHPSLKSCQLEVVSPTPGLAARGPGSTDKSGRRITSNSISASIRVLFNKKPLMLLASDMDEIALDDIAGTSTHMGAEFLVFPHHGGLPGNNADPVSFTTRLLNAVNPTAVLFSIGRGKHDNPRPEIVNTITKFNPQIHIGCTQISKHCLESINSVNRTYSIYSSGSQQGLCCLGSAVVKIDKSEIKFINRDTHMQFVKESIQHPLCNPANNLAI